MSQTNPTEIAKQFSLIAGSLTFLGFFLPQLFEGLPPIENLLLTVMAAAVMSILGWKFGLIWGEPIAERRVVPKAKASNKQETTVEALPSQAETAAPATPTEPAPTTSKQTDVVSSSISPEDENPSHSWEVNGTGDSEDATSRNREA